MASITSTSTGTISSPGIGSNLDVDGIISKLMAAESAGPTQIISTKQASYQAKLSAIGTLNASLSAFQTAVNNLSDSSIFQSVVATPTDATIVSTSSSSSAVPGNYNVTINQLAQAQSLSTAGQASTTATIGSGTATTITFDFGAITGGKLQNGQYVSDSSASPPDPTFTQDSDKLSASITIDSSNNSLQGIRDAINKANLGVTATIVSDGSANPYHLVLTSSSTGAKSSMKISVSGDSAVSNLLSYDPAGTQNLTQTMAAQNATLMVNGLSVTSGTNTVDGAIDGVSLTLTKTGTTSVSVQQDFSSVQSKLQAFVTAYNTVNSTIKKVTAVGKGADGKSTDTTQSGALIGDQTVQMIDFQLRNMLSSKMTGSSGSLSLLADVGISVDQNGLMSLDANKLSSALTKNSKDVAALFSTIGSTTDSLVSYSGSASNTPVGTYDVNITQLATQGKLVGSATIGTSTIISPGVNDSLTVTINGTAATVSLLAGTYTQAQLAAQIQSAINGASAFTSAGLAVTVNVDASGKLNLISNTFGSKSTVAATGNAATVLLGSSPVATTGVDVAGTIAGVAATGSGQYLTGADGSPAVGLKVQVTGGSLGSRGTVTFSKGFAFDINNLLNSYIGTDGWLPSEQKGIQSSIDDLSDQLDQLNTRLAAEEANYRAQFTALDTLISQMNTTSSFLTQQLSQISSLSSQSSSK